MDKFSKCKRRILDLVKYLYWDFKVGCRVGVAYS